MNEWQQRIANSKKGISKAPPVQSPSLIVSHAMVLSKKKGEVGVYLLFAICYSLVEYEIS